MYLRVFSKTFFPFKINPSRWLVLASIEHLQVQKLSSLQAYKPDHCDPAVNVDRFCSKWQDDVQSPSEHYPSPVKRKYCLILCPASWAQSIIFYDLLCQVPEWCLCLSKVLCCCFPFKALFLYSRTGLGSEKVLQTFLEICSTSAGLLKAYYVAW